MKAGERLAALEGLRGYAAALVLCTHTFGMLLGKLYAGIDAAHAFFLDDADPVRNVIVFLHRSHYGVDLFFVMSGLLMADIAARRWPGARRFLAMRALRIYPPYVASLVIAAAAGYYLLRRIVPPGEAIANLAILQGFFPLGIYAINPVTWSLSFEAAFYLSVPLAALAWTRGVDMRGKSVVALFALFVAIVAACSVLPGDRAIYLAYFALFIPGVAIGLLADDERVRLGKRLPQALALLAWAAFALAVKTGLLDNMGHAYYLASAVACGLVVLKACDPDAGISRLLASPVMRWLGRYSYSLFLVHFIVVQVWAAEVTSWLGTGNGLRFALVFLSGALVFSLVAARALYMATERWYFAARQRSKG